MFGKCQLVLALQIGQWSIDTASFINFITTPYIKQDDLLLNDHQGKDYPVTVGKTDRITVLQLCA
jgi:hypothetical protein